MDIHIRVTYTVLCIPYHRIISLFSQHMHCYQKVSTVNVQIFYGTYLSKEIFMELPALCFVCYGARNVYCHDCYGKGSVGCRTCYSRGTRTCTHCYGTGYDFFHEPCNRCGSLGYTACNRCFQTGSLSCTSCKGLGTRPCSACRGTGFQLSQDIVRR